MQGLTEKKPEEIKSCLPANTAAMLQVCRKMAELEKNWQEIFCDARTIAQSTAPGRCTIDEEGAIIEINVANKSSITALRFKEKQMRAKIENFLGTKIKKIEFVPGKVVAVSKARDASRVFERYAPVIVTEEQVEKEKQQLLQYTEDEELAGLIAKTKAIAEKKAKRK